MEHNHATEQCCERDCGKRKQKTTSYATTEESILVLVVNAARHPDYYSSAMSNVQAPITPNFPYGSRCETARTYVEPTTFHTNIVEDADG